MTTKVISYLFLDADKSGGTGMAYSLADLVITPPFTSDFEIPAGARTLRIVLSETEAPDPVGQEQEQEDF